MENADILPDSEHKRLQGIFLILWGGRMSLPKLQNKHGNQSHTAIPALYGVCWEMWYPETLLPLDDHNLGGKY